MVHAALDVCPPTEEDNIHFNKSYVSSIVAINKAVEFMLFMFSFALASNFKAGLVVLMESHQVNIPHGKLDFHIFIMSISWLGAIIMFLSYLFNVVNVIEKKFKHIFTVLAVLHAIGALFILITTAIILDNVIAFRNNRIVIVPPYKQFCDAVVGCSSYEGAGATSFFAIISVAFDAVLHIIKAFQVYRNRQIEEEEQAEDGQGDRNESFESHEPETPAV